MKIKLDLSRHCIETAVKKAYNRRLSMALRASKSDKTAEEEIELLKKALEGFDFSGLRSRFAELAGGSQLPCSLVRQPSGQLRIEVNKKNIHGDILWRRKK